MQRWFVYWPTLALISWFFCFYSFFFSWFFSLLLCFPICLRMRWNADYNQMPISLACFCYCWHFLYFAIKFKKPWHTFELHKKKSYSFEKRKYFTHIHIQSFIHSFQLHHLKTEYNNQLHPFRLKIATEFLISSCSDEKKITINFQLKY